MGFLRRILGGREPEPAAPATPDEVAHDRATADEAPDEVAHGEAAAGGAGPVVDEAERARERELQRADAARLEDELLQRQLRYADRSWTPPRQGGERRSEDGDAGGRE